MTIGEDSRFCNHCGAMVETTSDLPKNTMSNYSSTRTVTYNAEQIHTNPSNGLAIAGFSCSIASLFMPFFSFLISLWSIIIVALICLAGFVLSILGASRSKSLPNRSGHGLAVAGIVISSIQIAFTILSVIIIAWLLAGIGSMIGNSMWGIGKLIESFLSGYTETFKTFTDIFDNAFSSIP